jgi:hypothetical protein
MRENGRGHSVINRGTCSAGWNAVVDEHAATVWDVAKRRSATATQALEVFQLVWLRLELVARSGTFPDDPCAWLVHHVDDECLGLTCRSGSGRTALHDARPSDGGFRNEA